MGKKGKGAKGPTEAQPTEAESLLLLRIQLLEEKLSKAQLASDEAVIVRSEVNGKMTTEAQSHRDHVEYLNLQRENKEAELKALTDKYAQLVHEKEMSEKRLGKELGDMKAALDACEHKLAESDANVSRLNDQVVEIGTLRANATSDTGTLADLREELEMTKHQLFESQQHLQVLAMADDRIVGDDGTHALPLLLVEAIRLNLKKPVLIEQAMAAMQSNPHPSRSHVLILILALALTAHHSPSPTPTPSPSHTLAHPCTPSHLALAHPCTPSHILAHPRTPSHTLAHPRTLAPSPTPSPPPRR